MSDAAFIRQLSIWRFRGIKGLKWNPADGMNVILGGGDVGKTTLLEAVALLLSPSNTLVLSEADYWQRQTDNEFCIRAVLSLPSSSDITQQQKLALPWAWNGTEAITPPVPADGDDDMPPLAQPVYCFQVRGTAELEINWEIVHPNEEVDILSTALRRQIGVVRLTGDERNDRDLRLVYGSALDRLLADKGLRAKIGQQVSKFDLQDNLSEDANAALAKLDEALKKEFLPSQLKLGLTSSQGLSIGALIGLLAESDQGQGVSLPLASWGAGTRRMATLQIAAATESDTRITVIDELERGLEPYRVRKLTRALQAEATQSFVTTHSAVAISASDEAHLWHLDPAGAIGPLPRKKIARQQERDPETFLCRLAIIAEGPTEIGFVSYLLERAIDGTLLDHGLRVCNGQGNEATLHLLEAMAGAGLRFGGFVDNEGSSPGRWSALKSNMGQTLFQWASSSTDQNVIANIPEDKLTDLIAGIDAQVSASRRFTLAARLGISDMSLEAIQAKVQADDLRDLITAAATGNNDGAPDADSQKIWKRHGGAWFKNERGGRELAGHMFAFGAWPALKPSLLVFLNAVRAALGQPAISDVPNE